MGRIKILTTFATLLIVVASCFSSLINEIITAQKFKINIPYFINNRWYVVTKFSFQEDRSSVSVGDTNYSNILVQTFFTTRNIIFFLH